MKVQDLKIGVWYDFDTGVDKCDAQVIEINNMREKVTLKDKQGVEWYQYFEEIPKFIKSELA